MPGTSSLRSNHGVEVHRKIEPSPGVAEDMNPYLRIRSWEGESAESACKVSLMPSI